MASRVDVSFQRDDPRKYLSRPTAGYSEKPKCSRPIGLQESRYCVLVLQSKSSITFFKSGVTSTVVKNDIYVICLSVSLPSTLKQCCFNVGPASQRCWVYALYIYSLFIRSH